MSSGYGGYRKSIKLHAVAAVLATLNSPAHSAVLCLATLVRNDRGQNCHEERFTSEHSRRTAGDRIVAREGSRVNIHEGQQGTE